MKRGRTALHVLRAEQRVTQYEVARKAEMSQSRYWQIENGRGPEPSEDDKNAVATALGVTVSEITWPEFAKAKAS